MSYAKQIVTSLMTKYREPYLVIDFLRTPKSGVNGDFVDYMNLFDRNGKVIKRLYKYMYQYIIEEL